ncbi:VUT family protein [Stappia stellulata]|uniref:VUT family protein n=1 Tax=Stappia TaxID=152161 RepID=UPI001CD254E7|nr:VUT family protein [Stappia stellulata]MCA1244068.1 VUT family protein [Stappia stellulata]
MMDFRTFTAARALQAILAMALVVVASNILVQYPVSGTLGGINLADLLTWGAFTYPAAFLVTDLTNRRFGPAAARKVVFVGFALAVALSIFLATPRIAIASGSAFLFAHLLDIVLFDRMRRMAWWKAPILSSATASVLDTALFFGIAFSAAATPLLGYGDDFATGTAPFLGVFGLEVPRWLSWAAGDLAVKLLVAAALLLPYRLLLSYFGASPRVGRA